MVHYLVSLSTDIEVTECLVWGLALYAVNLHTLNILLHVDDVVMSS